MVFIFTLPLALAQHVYGPDALIFKPQRWMTSTTDTAADATADPATAGTEPHAPNTPSLLATGVTHNHADGLIVRPAPAPAGPGASVQEAAVSGAPAGAHHVGSRTAPASPPDPISFLTGPRDW